MFNKIAIFFKEVFVEVKRVNWPTLSDLLKYTLIVVGISFFVAMFFGFIDMGVRILIDKFIL